MALNKMLLQCVHETTPALINKYVVEGISVSHLRDIEDYMNRFLSGVFRGGVNNLQFKNITKCHIFSKGKNRFVFRKRTAVVILVELLPR